LKRHLLEYTDSLSTPSWTQIGNVLAANSNTLIVSNAPGSNVTTRSYRLRALSD
jgi:hypothetical protein